LRWISSLRWIKDPNVLFNGILCVATIALAIIGILQWQTFRRTDTTMRVGERAFIYLQDIDVQPLKPSSQGWKIVPNLINNGTTEATGVKTYISCSIGDSPSLVGKEPSLVGPKQTADLGYCKITADEIRRSQYTIRTIGVIFYIDTFRNSRQTRFCRNIIFPTEPSSASPAHSEQRCPDSPDCSDWDCPRS
jgi:hypothetical protein